MVAFTVTSETSNSEELSYKVQPKDTQRAIMAGLVGGILFFIVAIILAVCAVKICNRRKRRKQEKGEECHILGSSLNVRKQTKDSFSLLFQHTIWLPVA